MLLRWRAWVLVYHVLLRLRQGRYDDHEDGAVSMRIHNRVVVVQYVPRWPRIADGVIVSCDRTPDVWLPLLPRLVLRAAMRRVLIERALQ